MTDEAARRILGPGVEGKLTTGEETRSITLRDTTQDALRVHVRIAAINAAVAGGGISEVPRQTTVRAEEFEAWILRGISE